MLTIWAEGEELPSVLQTVIVCSDVRHRRGEVLGDESRHVELGVAVEDSDSAERRDALAAWGEAGARSG